MTAPALAAVTDADAQQRLADDRAAHLWAHYTNCDALVIVERLAQLLDCDEAQIERKVRALLRKAT